MTGGGKSFYYDGGWGIGRQREKTKLWIFLDNYDIIEGGSKALAGR